MLFNSWNFFGFLALILFVYHRLPHRWQNRLLLVASYVFYGWTDARLALLILAFTIINYFAGIGIFQARDALRRKRTLIFCIVANLLLLGFFKYWNFFAENWQEVLSLLGLQTSSLTLRIILPIGISFYTFQVMSYSIDLYRGEIRPTINFIDFALFVSYFPHLIAGPIMRGKTLLPQISGERSIGKEQVLDGVKLIFWGLFKKIFVADNLAVIVNRVYGDSGATGIEYGIATWAFAFQIYGDFSGYSDIARGVSKLLGIELVVNFNQPYLAVSPADFWRRWHISLSTWLRDYLYIPMGGNRKGTARTYCNLLVTMVLGGLWHGAAWNFVLWGTYHGLLLVIYHFFSGGRHKESAKPPGFAGTLGRALIMFQVTSLGWLFFRSQDLQQILSIFQWHSDLSWFTPDSARMLREVIFYSFLPLLAMIYEMAREKCPSERWRFQRLPVPLQGAFCGALTYLLLLHGAKAETFIYFQF
jgi:alginate O-acetyltransferase complex protein AlgI